MLKIKRKNLPYSQSQNYVVGLIEGINNSGPDYDADYARTHSFITEAFYEYESNSIVEKVDFAFLIPLRVSKTDDKYWNDVYDFLPVLKYTDIETRYKILSHLPPCKIEMYGLEGKPSKGVLVFTPIFIDMLKEHRSKVLLARKLNGIINDTVNFAITKYGVEYIGLGAILPKITRYGKSIKANVTTTTGHAGTTWLIHKTYQKVVNHMFKDKLITIGFIGGGAIGSASIELIVRNNPNFNYIIHDKRSNINTKNARLIEKYGATAEVAKSNKELIKKSDIIISAVTSAISVEGMDLQGKVIIDDSQPGSFSKEEVENAGGRVVWVVAKNASGNPYLLRRKGYDYGPLGLSSGTDLWGCEAEIASIAYYQKPEIAISKAISMRDVENIGKLFNSAGVEPSNYQAYGEFTNL